MTGTREEDVHERLARLEERVQDLHELFLDLFIVDLMDNEDGPPDTCNCT